MLYLGCPVLSFKGWVGNFYPSGTKSSDYLREYAKRVTTIEGNTTFYAVPSKETLEKWVADTPETFRFCPKVPKVISHEGKLADMVDRAHGFVDVMQQLGTRLGPMFLQLPPRYSPSLLAENDMARVTIDTRPIRNLHGDQSLAGSSYQSLLEARERKPDVPVVPKRTADFVFVRYIGHPDMEINRPFLDEWGSYFSSQIKDGADVYAFCHSPDNLIAPTLCKEVHLLVSENVDVSPLPWDDVKPDVPQQGTLF